MRQAAPRRPVEEPYRGGGQPAPRCPASPTAAQTSRRHSRESAAEDHARLRGRRRRCSIPENGDRKSLTRSRILCASLPCARCLASPLRRSPVVPNASPGKREAPFVHADHVAPPRRICPRILALLWSLLGGAPVRVARSHRHWTVVPLAETKTFPSARIVSPKAVAISSESATLSSPL